MLERSNIYFFSKCYFFRVMWYRFTTRSVSPANWTFTTFLRSVLLILVKAVQVTGQAYETIKKKQDEIENKIVLLSLFLTIFRQNNSEELRSSSEWYTYLCSSSCADLTYNNMNGGLWSVILLPSVNLRRPVNSVGDLSRTVCRSLLQWTIDGERNPVRPGSYFWVERRTANYELLLLIVITTFWSTTSAAIWLPPIKTFKKDIPVFWRQTILTSKTLVHLRHLK